MKPLLWKYPGKLIGVIALRTAATVAGTAFTLMLAELLNSAVQGSVRRLLLTGGTVIVLMLLAQVFEYVTSIQKNRLLREWNVLLKSTLFSRLKKAWAILKRETAPVTAMDCSQTVSR